MKLLFVSEATGWTGGANQIWLTSRELSRRGHTVAVACPPGEMDRRLREAGVETVDVPIVKEMDPRPALRLRRALARFKPDVLHAHHPRAHMAALLALWLAAPVPLLVTRRVIFPIRRNPVSRMKYRSRRVSRYIAVCQAAARELEFAGVERERITVIPSAVELGRYEAALRAREGLNGATKVITMVGNYHPVKGHEVLLRAAALVLRRAPDTEFRVIGRDTEGLAAKAQALGVAAKVRLMGERSDVPELLAQSHVYVMPSLMEGIGTALIEAQAAGVPVVASDVGGLPDVVENGVTGTLVPPGDAGALAEGLLGALHRPAQAAEMARRGLERVSLRFSLEAVTDRLESLYSSLLP